MNGNDSWQYWIKGLLLLTAGLLTLSCFMKDKGVFVSPETTNICNPDDAGIIKEYLRADEKYHMVPVPTKLDQTTVLILTKQELNDVPSQARAGKISRLAVFYDLKKLLPDFERFLREQEKDVREIYCEAWSVIALAQIGQDQNQTAHNYYPILLKRADFQKYHRLMFVVCDALNTEQAMAQFRSWISQYVQALNEKIKYENNPVKKDQLDIDLANIQDFSAIDVSDLTEAVEMRQKVLQMPDLSPRIKKLTEFYMDDDDLLNEWAAIKLTREAQAQKEAVDLIKHELRIMAELYKPLAEKSLPADDEETEVVEEEMSDEQDMIREASLKMARCLRAAVYFGSELTQDQTVWLKRQFDYGVDPLALRPNWNYSSGR
ncbi:MAG: hypothetical protein KAJ46_03590 [Sedimentisphaerales bacterium]|nr:hypothetical protein [Sedimentisphaerales bacterium]